MYNEPTNVFLRYGGNNMGMPCKQLPHFENLLDWHTSNLMVLEIGSDRGEGSTDDLYNIASQHKVEVTTVDVVDWAKRNSNNLCINYEVYRSGSAWCAEILPMLNKKIKILYLDNFDWTWNEAKPEDWILRQQKEYRDRGVVMNNINCVNEHLLQAMHCLPYLDDNCLVICDDTWKCTNLGIYVGKCGPAAHYLIQHGFNVIYLDNSSMILGRNLV